jgi:hypothetical protein
MKFPLTLSQPVRGEKILTDVGFVKKRTTQVEHISSAVPATADI